MENKSLAQVTAVISVIAVIMAVVDSMGVGVWLSANSWLIVAATVGIWSLIFKPAK